MNKYPNVPVQIVAPENYEDYLALLQEWAAALRELDPLDLIRLEISGNYHA